MIACVPAGATAVQQHCSSGGGLASAGASILEVGEDLFQAGEATQNLSALICLDPPTPLASSVWTIGLLDMKLKVRSQVSL